MTDWHGKYCGKMRMTDDTLPPGESGSQAPERALPDRYGVRSSHKREGDLQCATSKLALRACIWTLQSTSFWQLAIHQLVNTGACILPTTTDRLLRNIDCPSDGVLAESLIPNQNEDFPFILWQRRQLFRGTQSTPPDWRLRRYPSQLQLLGFGPLSGFFSSRDS